MNRHLSLAALFVLSLGCGAKVDDKKPADKPATAAPAAPAPATPAAPTPAAKPAAPRVSVSLRVKDVPLKDPDADYPKTEVSLVVAEAGKPEQVKTLDTVMGGCSEMSEPGQPPAYNCWYAGSGDNFRVEQKGSDIVVFKREVGEAEDAPALDLPEKEIARMPLPAGAEVKFTK
jgi:hypothetical protein